DSFFPDDALHVLVGSSQARFARKLMSTIDPFLHEVFPNGQASLNAVPRLPDSYPASVCCRLVAAALGVHSLLVLRGSTRGTMLLLSDPRAIVFGPEDLADGSLPRVFFHSAYNCSRIAAGTAIGPALPAEQVRALVEVIADGSADGPGYRDLRKRLASVLPR